MPPISDGPSAIATEGGHDLRAFLAGDPPSGLIVALLELRADPGAAARPPREARSEAGVYSFAARRSAIEAALRADEARFGAAFASLFATGVVVRSPNPAAMVRVAGTAGQLRRVIDLPGVVGGVADFEIEIDLGRSPDGTAVAAPTPFPTPRQVPAAARSGESPLMRHLEWISENQPRSPIGKAFRRIVAATQGGLTPLAIPVGLWDRMIGVEGLEPVGAMVREVGAALAERSAVVAADRLLRAALLETGGWSATLFVRDPWHLGEYRLLLCPGVRHAEPLHGCSSQGPVREMLVGGKNDEDYFDQADAANRHWAGGPPDDARPRAGAGHAHAEPGQTLDELTKRDKLFGTFDQREGARSCARLLGRRGEAVLFSLWVNFARPAGFKTDGWLKERLTRLRDDLLTVAGDVVDELPPPPPLSVDRFNRLEAQARRLTATAKQNPGLTLNDWLKPILEAAVDAFQIRETGFATIHLPRPGTGMLEVVAAAGRIELPAEPWQQSMVKGDGLTVWVALKGRPLLIKDMRRSAFRRIYCRIPNRLDAAQGDKTQSELAVPLMDGDQVIGVFNLESTAAGRFDEESVRVVTHAARLAAQACQKWDEETQAKERHRVVERLLQLTREFADARREPRPSLRLRDRWAEIVCQAMHAQYCDLWRYDPTADDGDRRWKLLATHATEEARLRNVAVVAKPRPRSGDRPGWTEFVARHKQLVCVTDVRSEQEFEALFWDAAKSQWRRGRPDDAWQFKPDSVNRLVRERGVRCELGIPIFEGGECRGVAWIKYLSVSVPRYASPLKDWLPGTATMMFDFRLDMPEDKPTPFSMDLAVTIRDLSEFMKEGLIGEPADLKP